MRLKYKFLKETKSEAFVNHTLLIGKSGSGKSNALESIGIDMVNRWKVIDLYDSGRFENMLYGMKEIDPKLTSKLYNLLLQYPKTTLNEKIIMAGPDIEVNNKFPKSVKICSLNDEDLKI